MTEQWQELKETIIEMHDNDGTGTQQEVCIFLANLMDIFEKQMQEQKTGHWIPVSEKLPEDNIKVLVSTETAVGFASHDDIGWYIIHGYIDGIIAWMPLPQTYKAEGSEADEDCD